MRIGCLQFAPQVGDVPNNLNRADACLSRADPMELDSLDLLILPEMSFSGYNFKSLDHIMPYLEPSGSGISALWARTTALKYDCIVAVGYPEKVDSSRQRRFSAPRYYNSLIMVNGDGETLANYRKSFLYYTDATWAEEGSGFFGGKIDGLGQVAMGICMDINPYKFESPWNKYEFGCHIIEVKANLVILSMAWLTQEDSSTFTPFNQEPDMETISYWIQRLEPIVRREQEDEIIVVFCNRCGIEDDVVYAGTSAVVGIKNGEVAVYGLLGRGVKELLIVNTDLPPFAKLISHPAKAAEAQVEPSTTVPVPSPIASPARVSPTKERLSRLPETEEPVEDSTTTGMSSPISTLGSPGSATKSPTTTAPMTQVTPPRSMRGVTSSIPGGIDGSHTEGSRPSVSTTSARGFDKHTDHGHSKGGNNQSRSPGNCSGFCQHCQSDTLDTVLPSTVTSARPKLAISTGSVSLPAVSTRVPPEASQLGNVITARDLCTPPMTAFDEAPMTAIDDIPMSAFPTRYSRHYPPQFPPPSANVITPEEPIWPTIDFKRTTTISARVSVPRSTNETHRLPFQAPPRPSGRLDQPNPVQQKLTGEPHMDGNDVQALKAAVRHAGFATKETDVPPRPEAPKSRNASREASRSPSRNVKRNPSRDSSRDPKSRDSSKNRSRNTSRNGGSRCPSRDQSREPSRNPGRGLGEDERPPSSFSHQPLHSEPVRGRAKSSRAKSSSPTRHNTTAVPEMQPGLNRSRNTEGHIAAKTLLSSFKATIPIAISTSLLQTEHGHNEIPAVPTVQRPASNPGHRRSRSASNVTGYHQHQVPLVSGHSRFTADFSAVWSSQRHHEAEQAELQRSKEGDVIHAVASFDNLLRSPVVPEDEAFFGRTLSGAESWRKKRAPRRTLSGGGGGNSLSAHTSPVERVQPTFFF